MKNILHKQDTHIVSLKTSFIKGKPLFRRFALMIRLLDDVYNLLIISRKKNILKLFRKKIENRTPDVVSLHHEMIEVEVQKVTFRKTKAYLSARKSIALETQNGTSGE